MAVPVVERRRPDAGPERRGRIGRVVAVSLLAGAVAPLVLVLVVVPGAAEHVVAGLTLLGGALGWVLLVLGSARWTDQPQRWALVPAAVLGTAGVALLLAAPGDEGMAALGWVWPPALLGLAGWVLVRARRSLGGRARSWLVIPACLLVALTAVAGGVETVRGPATPAPPSAGRTYDVGGHRLYLECRGSGGPTVVLNSGAGLHSSSWAWIAPAVAEDTRVCAYDRAGLGWSEPVAHPQDGVDVAADLHALLAAAGEAGPYVLVGHSVGGPYDLVFAERYPADVAGLVLLDSSSPGQFALPGYAETYERWRRVSALFPSLARLGLGRVAGGAAGAGLPPDARQREQDLAATARDLRGQRDEWSQLPALFEQAQALSDLGATPLVVVTAGSGHDRAWSDAQDRLAALSTDSLHRVVDGARHADLVLQRGPAGQSARAVLDLVHAVRAGAPLSP